MPLKYFVYFVFFFLTFAQDSSSPNSPAPSSSGPNEVQKVFDEVVAHRQILDHISRTLKDLPVTEGLRSLESVNTKSQESLQTISAVSEILRRLETLVGNLPQRVADAAGSGADEEFQKDLKSQLTSLQKLVENQKTSVDGLRDSLKTLLEQTEKLEQLTKIQKASSKQSELLETILANQQTIFANQNKILTSLADKSFADTARLYYGKLCNGTHEVIKFFSDAFSSKKGTAAASFQKNAGAFLSQVGASTTKALGQGQELVVKAHGEIANSLKTQVGLADPWNIYAATALLTVPLSLLALLIVTFAFKFLRILGSIVFYPCYCCFRRRARHVEDGESKKRKSPEDQTTAAKSGKKGKTH